MSLRRFLILALLLTAPSAHASYRPIGGVLADRFDAAKKAWVVQPVRLSYRAEPEGIQVELLSLKAGQPLTLRLDFKHLPHYGEWMAQRQAQGGATWTALRALLDEVGDGPAMALVAEPLPKEGPVEVKLGLRRGSRFELYAAVRGPLVACGTSLCFEPGEPQFVDQSAALAWKLLKPLARSQAKASLKR